MDPDVETYRTTALPYFFAIASTTFIFGNLSGFLVMGHKWRLIEMLLLQTAAFSVVWSLLGTTFLIVTFKVNLSPRGIRGHSIWGVPHYFTWESIIDCKHINMLGFRYLILKSSENTAKIWLPLFIKNKDSFVRKIKKYSMEHTCIHRAIG